MRRKIKIVLSCIVTLCLTLGVLGYLTNLLEGKSSYEKYADFFSQKEDFNVLFLGTSHVINAVYPMELWDDYGIVSYNFGGHSNKIATTYWTMENALDYTKPDLIVMDGLYLAGVRKSTDLFSHMHLSLDAFPLSITKIKAIWDLMDDPNLEAAINEGRTRESAEPRTKIGLLWDYSVYHNRWIEIEKNDFEPSINLEKGAEARINIVRNELEKIPSTQKMEPGSLAEGYLRMLIEDCQRRGIEVLLTYLPFPASVEQQEEANYLYDIAEEYGVNYINFLDMDLINYQTDLYDENSHVNSSGARKITNYLGNYIMEHYDIPDQRNNPAYEFWNQDYEEYVGFKNRNLKKQKEIVKYLMLLAEEKADILLDVRNKDLYQDEWIMELLANIGVDKNAVSENTDFIIKLEGQDQAVAVNDFREDGVIAETDIGSVQLLMDSENGEKDEFGIYVNGEERFSGKNKDEAGLIVIVKRGDKIADKARFIFTIDQKTSEVKVSEAKHK